LDCQGVAAFLLKWGLISSISYELGWIVEESLHFDQLGIGFAPFPTSLDCQGIAPFLLKWV
jgi:hypothetical protein